MNEFNLEFWNERFDNLKASVEEIKKTVNNLVKLMLLTVAGIAGWALVQLYVQIATNKYNPVISTAAAAEIKK